MWNHSRFAGFTSRCTLPGMKRTIYIAGPMRGHFLFNFPAFDMARDQFIALGHDVISPADIDRQHGFHPETLPENHNWNDIDSLCFSLKDAVIRDVEAISRCDTIAMLPGWLESRGARAEFAVAKWLGIDAWVLTFTGSGVFSGQPDKPDYERFSITPASNDWCFFHKDRFIQV